MFIRTIMGVCSLDQTDEDIRIVAELCAKAEAHLSLVVVAIAEPPPTGEYVAELTTEWQQLRQDDLQKIASKTANLERLLSRYGISYEIGTEYAEYAWLDNAVGLRARYSDLVILDRNTLSLKSMAGPLIEGSLFQSARPVLVSPANTALTLWPKTVLIAWDSRQESARAIYCALDILATSEDVHVTLVDPVASDLRNGAEPGADVAAYLARHGLSVTVDRLPSGGRPVADVLKQHAVDISADLFVMGAYGHSRLRERIFGGMTRSFIKDADLPVLMVH